MKTVILDTDIGADCDDTAALALLFNLQADGVCHLAAVTACSGREGATATVRALADYYGVSVPCGYMAPPALACDAWDHYAKRTMERYGTADTSEIEAVALLRKTLAAADGRVTVAAVGPLTNMARLLQSGPDESSSLDGRALVAAKVDRLYLMGGGFLENYRAVGWEDEPAPKPSWNIVQDVPAARYVEENWPTERVWSPYEAGFYVYTRMGVGDNPVWFAMECFGRDTSPSFSPSFARASWDPLTALAAVSDIDRYFALSPLGRVLIEDNGATRFAPGEGKDLYLINRENYLEIADVINDLIPRRQA